MKTRVNIYLFCILSLVCSSVYGFDWPFSKKSVESETRWQGKWFPLSPDKEVDDNPIVESRNGKLEHLHDEKHGIKMGESDPNCDDGKVNITVDWNDSPINYTCYGNKRKYLPNTQVHPIFHCDSIPAEYSAQHKCMFDTITYEDVIPTYGTHRPLWAKWGEYLYLPRQRWLHNLEHGGVAMLYHPCANKLEVALLKKLVKGCLYRHVITPFNLLPPERPLALVAWGNRLEMSKVVPRIVTEFIKSSALRGPEQKSKDGQFDHGLVEHATIVSDQDDSHLCPNFNY